MRNSVVLLNISIPATLSSKDAFDRMKLFSFTGREDFGFADMSYEEDAIDAVLISRSHVFVNNYDTISGRIKREKVTYIVESGFRIDFSNLILEYSGKRNNFSYFKQKIKSLWGDFVIESIHLNLTAKINELNDKFDLIKLDFVNLPRFRYSENLVGKFQVKVYDQKEGLKLLEQYDDDILSVKFTLSDFDEVPVELTSDFRITAHCNRSEFLSIIKKLK